MNSVTSKMRIFKKVGINYLSYKMGYPKPFFCLYVSTLQCNLRCKHCFVESPHQYDKEKKEYWDNLSKDLTTEQAKYAIDQLDKIGISVLHITGGEPLLRKDLEQIALHAKMKGMYVSMDTNGTLMTIDRAKSLSCFERIGISVDGIGETHEIIRGINTFEKTKNAIKLLKKYTSSMIGIVFTINKMNYNNIDSVFEFAKEHGDFVTFLPIDNIKELSLNEEKAKEIGEKIIKLKKENYSFIENPMEYIELLPYFLQGMTAIECNVECHPSALYFVLGPSGDLSGCTSLHSYVGNVLKDDIMDMHKQGISKISDTRSKCGGCSITCAIQNSMLFNQSVYKAIVTATSKFLRS
ncbi:MAG: radical SAM protein [Candidatus Methanoperedens sp.]|nr:radical SAM protein [Candidatus Methanoperedens sp.]MCZ7371834.1 radical SAM protein [Candidatus Methanoperedens sp.]